MTDVGPLLIDPASGGAIPHHAPAEIVNHPGFAGLITCTQSGGMPVLWFDGGGDAIQWQSLDGLRSGELHGFARSANTWDEPLVDVADSFVAVVAAEGRTVDATQLPDGTRLASIPVEAFARILHGDRMVGFGVLSSHLVTLQAFRDQPSSDVKFRRYYDTFVVNVDFDRGTVGQGVIIEEAVPHSVDDLDFLSGIHVDADGKVAFKILSEGQPKNCQLLAVLEGPVEANCTPAAMEKPLWARAEEHLDAYDRDISPSGRWFAWDEWISGQEEPSKVRFYVAPTTDLLGP